MIVHTEGDLIYLCLRRGTTKIERYLHLFYIFYLSVCGFEATDIFCQCLHQSLCMLWSKYDTGLDFTFWSTWHDVYKIDYKF